MAAARARHTAGPGLRVGAAIAGLALCLAGAVQAAGTEPAPVASGLIEAPLHADVAPGGAQVDLDLPAPLGRAALPVADPASRDRLLGARRGDLVRVRLDSATQPQRVVEIAQVSRPVAGWPRLVALLLAGGVVIGLGMLVTGCRAQQFLVGLDGRYSNSQTQFVLWWTAVASVYLSAVALRLICLGWNFIGGVGLTPNLIALSGLSAFSFGGARMITRAKMDGADAAQRLVKVDPDRPATPSLLRDLVRNDKGQADLGDFQMILVTLAAVTIFVLDSFHFLAALAFAQSVTLPDVDTALLSAFGIGQGAYLFKKGASKPGEG